MRRSRAVVARAALFSDDKTVIIVKAEDDAPYSPYVVRHARHMMGDVCDVLWEAAKLSPDMPLLLASSRGYRYDFTLPAMTRRGRPLLFSGTKPRFRVQVRSHGSL